MRLQIAPKNAPYVRSKTLFVLFCLLAATVYLFLAISPGSTEESHSAGSKYTQSALVDSHHGNSTLATAAASCPNCAQVFAVANLESSVEAFRTPLESTHRESCRHPTTSPPDTPPPRHFG